MKEIINDPTLGTLIFNEQADWYETTVQTATDGEVRLTIWTDAFSASDDELIPVRESLLLLLKALPNAKAFLAGELLEMKNSLWLEHQQEPLSQDELNQELELESLTANLEQEWVLFFKADELFGGHCILMGWSPTRGFYEAQIAG